MASPSSPSDAHAAGDPIPIELTGVRWPDGTVECRFRLLHPAGSLIATDGDVGQVLTDHDVECTACSDACAV